VDGLSGVRDVTVSPDGLHVYAAGSDEDAVAIFERDPTSGALTFQGVVRDGEDGVDGLDEVWAVAVSPDGAHLYAAGRSDDAVARFERDAESGALSFLGATVDGNEGVEGIVGPRALAFSPNGQHLYVAGAGSSSVALFSRTPATGALGFEQALYDGQGGVDGLANLRHLAVSADGENVYAAAINDLAVGVFSRDPASGLLAFVEKETAAGSGSFDPVGVEVAPDGGFVYAATQGGNALVVYARSAVNGALTFVERETDGQGGADGLSSAGRLVLSPDGTQVLVTGTIDDSLAAFTRDGVNGTIAFHSIVKDARGMDFASSAIESPDGAHVYVAAQDDDAVSAWVRDPGSGALSFLEAELDPGGNANGLRGARYAELSPDGAHLYVASAFGDALAVYARDPATGALTFVEAERDGQAGADGLDAVTQVVVSPDGEHVYTSGQMEASVGVFERDGVTGAVTFREKVSEGVGSVDGLTGVQGLAISPDGANLYAGGTGESAIAVFIRGEDGGLDFLEVQRDGQGGVDGLAAVRALAVSPDGAHLYAASFSDQAVAVFARDPATGALSFLELHREGEGGVTGIDAASSIDVGADGAYVVATGASSLALFGRDRTTGRLEFVEVHREGVAEVVGLDGPARVATSPTGARVYVAGRFSDAIAVFVPEPGVTGLALAALLALRLRAVRAPIRRSGVPARRAARAVTRRTAGRGPTA
jgi:6-phosphogluconolactonase (cycloisomerase 2 family)